jgi:thiamine biosynthesis lipoprotein
MTATDEWSALGTYAQIAITRGGDIQAAGRLARTLVARVDETCSRFRDDSDLSQVNNGSGRWIRVDPLLVSAVAAAVEAARQTDGLVDPTVGGQLTALGYDADLDVVRARGTGHAPSGRPARGPTLGPTRGPGRPHWSEIELDRAGAIRVPAGCSLDLGATGKAFAADLVATALHAALDCGVIVSLGGDVSVAGPAPGQGWPVLVSDTAGPSLDEQGPVVCLPDGGLATSSIKHRRWWSGGKRVHHIVDPRTGHPTDGTVVSASVRASSCVAANAASTAAIILGADAGAWLAARNLPSALLHATGRAETVADWPRVGAGVDRVEVPAPC